MADFEKFLSIEFMEELITGELDRGIEQFALDLETVVKRMQGFGMSDSAILDRLAEDLANEGRLFSQVKNAPKGSLKNAIDQASRSVSENVFVKKGVEIYRWVTISKKPCPDCVPRHGMKETMEYFETIGTPGSGFSVCLSNCKCRLLPAGYKGEDLSEPIKN